MTHEHSEVVLLRAPTKQVTIPDDMSLEGLLQWLQRRIADENQWVGMDHAFTCFPLEGAHALAAVMAERFGWTSLTPKKTWWGDEPPRVVSIRTGVGQSVGVPWGRLVIPDVEGWIETKIGVLRGVPVLRIVGEVKRKHEPVFRELIHQAERHVKEHSIYQAQAIKMIWPMPDIETATPEDFQPEFIDLSDVDPDQIVFPEVVQIEVDRSIMAPVLHTEACRRHNIPLKRGVVLGGPYGCGKTLLARILAKIATEKGWTYLMLPNVDGLAPAVEFARRFQPAVIFSEDIDQALAGPKRDSKVNAILNVIDGIEAKDSEIMVLLTTNHLDRLNRAMLRPGRLDAVIPVLPPDAEAAIKLVVKYTGDLLEATEEELAHVGQTLDGQIPAVIREACERAKLSAIANHGDAERITPRDLLDSAKGMALQIQLLADEQPDDREAIEKAADTIGMALRTALGGANGETKHVPAIAATQPATAAPTKRDDPGPLHIEDASA